MKSLSCEILTKIFQYLNHKDTISCLLTCKEWHSVAERILYSGIPIISEDSVKLLVRTLKTSSHLGKLVKSIETYSSFQNEDKLWLWDEQNFLNVIAQHCPNLLKIEDYCEDITIWIQISHLLTKGQLSQLQSISQSNSSCLEPYLYTVLLLKNSLFSINVRDNNKSFGVDLKELTVYNKFQNQINEFKNLQELFLEYQSNNQLSDFDTMIESLPRLKKLRFHLTPTKKQSEPIEYQSFVCRPRPDITELFCNWNMINSQSQLEYIMKKFQNLKKLSVTHPLFADDKFGATTFCSYNTIMEYIRFVVPKIPSYFVELEIEGNVLGDVWRELINMKDIYRDVEICYYNKKRSEDKAVLNLSSTISKIWIPFKDEDEELTHLGFLTESKNMIRSVGFKGIAYEKEGDIFNNLTKFINLLYDIKLVSTILQLCPELQHLQISALPYEIPSNYLGFRHTKVNKLTIDSIGNTAKCLEPLKYFSLNLPNLKYLELKYQANYGDEDSFKVLTVYMPNSWLDQLTSNNLTYNRKIFKYPEALIKLSTDAGVNYYIGNKAGLLAISEELYRVLPRNCFSFDITCRALREIIITQTYSSDDIKWVF
ncbi:hypothetical protein BD770DRAFT_382172 [Pilaira anomala]|nr:hypothetical protein BD770DRAFT_382172 [Pilaira anomala]